MIKRIVQFFTQRKKKEVIIVSGLPRSGTSLMMKMLEAGGIPPLTDQFREADTDNPKGYYEFERVKKLPDGDTVWLDDASGHVVKVISALLTHLPEGTYSYRILFMERAIPEVIASQKKMLVRRGEDPNKTSNEDLTAIFTSHVAQVERWLQQNSEHISCHKVSYNGLLAGNSKAIITAIDGFLGSSLDCDAMAKVIDPSLYRNKG